MKREGDSEGEGEEKRDGKGAGEGGLDGWEWGRKGKVRGGEG